MQYLTQPGHTQLNVYILYMVMCMFCPCLDIYRVNDESTDTTIMCMVDMAGDMQSNFTYQSTVID